MLVTGLQGHLSRSAAVCRGMPFCLWETCGETPSRAGLVGFLWGERTRRQHQQRGDDGRGGQLHLDYPGRARLSDPVDC